MDHAVALVLSGLILVLSHAFDHSFAQKIVELFFDVERQGETLCGRVSHGR
jgi:hypothetical protein